MPKFWCCGRPSRYNGDSPEDGHGQVQHAKTPHVLHPEAAGYGQASLDGSWLAEAAMAACTSLAEVAAKGVSASSWPIRLLSQLQTLSGALSTSCARLAVFAPTSGGTATCVVSANCQGQHPWERPPAVAVGWSRTALHDRLVKQYQLNDQDTVTVINRQYDTLHGPDVASLSSHSFGVHGPAIGGGGRCGGPEPASPGSPNSPLLLRPGDLLALPIMCNGRVVAALLLGWGSEDGGSTARYQSIAGSSKQASLQHHPHSHPNPHYQQTQQSIENGTAAGGAGGGPLAVCPSDLRELRRLAQFLGFGLFSDPQQAVYLEEVAALIWEISHGAFTGLHDVVASVLDALPSLLQTRLALPLQPLLAAVLGNTASAVVFARRQGAGGGAVQACNSMTSNGGGLHSGRGLNPAVTASIGGGAGRMLGAASPGYGSTAGVDSRSGSRKYLGRDFSLQSLAVGTPGGLRSGELLGCDVGSAGMGPGGGAEGGGGDSSVSRVKAVRTALAYTLLQRVLRVGPYSACGAEAQSEMSFSGPTIIPLVVPNASSQVLEEEQPGRDVLLAANLTGGAGVACMVLCAEACQIQPNNVQHAAAAVAAAAAGSQYSCHQGGAWSAHGPMWASANAAVAATPVLEGSWGVASRLSRYGAAAAAGAAAAECSVNSNDAAPLSEGGGGGAGRNMVLAAALAQVRAGIAGELGGSLPGGVSTPPATHGSLPFPTGLTLPYRLALYLASSESVPAGVLEAVADEMKGLLPLVFGAMRTAISAGSVATNDFCALQAQLLQRSTTSGTLDLPTPQPHATPSTERRPAPPGLAAATAGGGSTAAAGAPLHQHHPSPLQPNGNHAARSLGSAPPKCPRNGNGIAACPSGARRGSVGGIGSTSRLRLASPGPPPPPGGGSVPGGGAAGAADGGTLDLNGELILTSASSERPDAGGGTGTGGGVRGVLRGDGNSDAVAGGRGGAGGGGGSRGRVMLPDNMDDLAISSQAAKDYEAGNSAPNLQPPGFATMRKISSPCYVLSSPVLRLEDVAGPRPLELLVTSARTRLTAVAAGSDAGGEARLSVAQDLAAVDLHEVIGSGGQGVVFRGTLHGLETAVKVWEHNGRAPLEHDGEWLSSDAAVEGGNQPDGQHAPGAEPVASSRDCIRQAKRGAMEVAVTVTLSHPNVVQPYAHFSDVVVVERQPAMAPAPGSPSPGPLQLRLCAHDDPVFRGQKAGPLNTVLCLEYCDAGTLLSAARRGDFRLPDSGPRDGPVWPDLVPLYTSLLEVSLALRYLHSRRLVHCDLKPGNVLLKTSTRDPRGWTCKLSDFGCVRLMDEVSPEGVPGFRMAQVFGTVAYMAPECFSKGRLLGTGVDIFAFGVLMWELMHCKPPHAGIDPKELPRLVARSNVRPDFHPLAPPDYRSLACSCWASTPERRPTATQLVSQLQLLLGNAKAAAASQQQAHRRHNPQRMSQPNASPAATPLPPPQQQQHYLNLSPQKQAHLPLQQLSPQLQLQQKRQLLRFPSAQPEGRLCDRVVLEQAHQAMVQQAAQNVLQPPQRQQHQAPQRPLAQISSLGSCPEAASEPGSRGEQHSLQQQQPPPPQKQQQGQLTTQQQKAQQRDSGSGVTGVASNTGGTGGGGSRVDSPARISPAVSTGEEPTLGA